MKTEKQKDKRLQFFLLQIVLYGAFTSMVEINSNIWPQHTRLMSKILDLLRNSTLIDDENLQFAWILTLYSRKLTQAQLNSCKDLSIHWDMTKGNNHQPSLKLFVDLLEPLSRKLEQSRKSIAEIEQKINNLEELPIAAL